MRSGTASRPVICVDRIQQLIAEALAVVREAIRLIRKPVGFNQVHDPFDRRADRRERPERA